MGRRSRPGLERWLRYDIVEVAHLDTACCVAGEVQRCHRPMTSLIACGEFGPAARIASPAQRHVEARLGRPDTIEAGSGGSRRPRASW